MARGHQRSKREKRKPKAEKATSKPATQTSPFECGPGMGSPKRAVKKKGR